MRFGENLEPREWGRALEDLKRAEGLPSDFHGKIMGNGDFLNSDTGELIGNIGDYILEIRNQQASLYANGLQQR